MGCFKSGAVGLLILLNFVFLLLGCFLLGVSIYLRVQFSTGWETIVSLNAVYVGMAAGAIMIVLSIFGCMAANSENGKCDFIYLVLIIGTLGLTIACTVLANEYKGAFAIVADNPSWDLTTGPTITLNNGLLSMYTACCSGCVIPSQCNNVYSYYNKTIPQNCLLVEEIPIPICEFVAECPTTILPVTPNSCYNIPADAVDPKLPTDLIDVSICTTLSGFLTNESIPLVGPAISGSCGGGSASNFRKDVNLWFADRWYWIAIAMAVICAIQGVIIICTIVVLCSPHRRQSRN